jgi:hypothetical protein
MFMELFVFRAAAFISTPRSHSTLLQLCLLSCRCVRVPTDYQAADNWMSHGFLHFLIPSLHGRNKWMLFAATSTDALANGITLMMYLDRFDFRFLADVTCHVCTVTMLVSLSQSSYHRNFAGGLDMYDRISVSLLAVERARCLKDFRYFRIESKSK